MYTDFFGLNEIPFSIAPNPHYLFMSTRHKEALAHLTYGLGSTGGFVLLTGEVGTGKTTVSRRLLDTLGDDTQAAFILNPTLSSQELLATICDELKIRYRKTGATLKTLTDKIQEKLLKNHQAEINTVLIIDEAQHLKPEVLEQLRLLTNLETHTKKLLQVILIGQPELQRLLQRQDLRQLAQRITARYHLLPLNKDEVGQYIQHRLNVAGSNKELFNTRAVSTIHQLSKGIPRLINLLCDRALLGAFGKGQNQVDRKLVLGASAEALGQEYQLIPWWKNTIVRVSAVLLSLVIMTGLGFYLGQGNGLTASTAHLNMNGANGVDANVSGANVGGNLESYQQNEQLLLQKTPLQHSVQKYTDQQLKPEQQRLIEQSVNLPKSVQQLFALWKITLNEAIIEPCITAKTYDLSCYWYKGNLSNLLKLNYPAVFKFFDQQGQPFYGLLTDVSANGLVFHFGETNFQVDKTWLENYWQGGAMVLWQAPLSENGDMLSKVDDTSSVSSIQWLEQQLSKQQKRPIRNVDDFDKRLLNQLQQFQRENSINPQTYADTVTLMKLTNTVAQGLPIFTQEGH